MICDVYMFVYICLLKLMKKMKCEEDERRACETVQVCMCVAVQVNK